ncbi:MAG: ABC transporter permease [Gemmatimonadota bacterium]
MKDFLKEFVLAGRGFRKTPGFFAAAVISLALGVAANSTIFAALDAFLVRPLPYKDPEQLVQVWTTVPERGWDEEGISLPEFEDWQRESRLLTFGGYAYRSYSLAGTDAPERLIGYQVKNVFGILGVQPMLGRTLGPADEEPGNDHVAVLSAKVWERRFNSDPGIIGQPLLLGGQAYTVVGVMSPHFDFPENGIDLWTPLVGDGTEKRDDRAVSVVGRIAKGTDQQQATTEIVGIVDRLARAYPESNAGVSARTVALDHEVYNDTFRQAALICTVAVAFVLLIACANVANLLLARGAVRGRELAVRAALGAGRWRIIRQLLAESMLLALAGGALGLVLSYWGVRGFVSIMPASTPRMSEVAVNGRLLIYTLGLSLVSGIVFGLAPALSASRADLYSSLRETGRTGSAGRDQGRLRKIFVVAEISLALVLLVAAGLLIKASIQLQRTDLGFVSKGLLTGRVALPEKDYADSNAVITFYTNLADRLAQIPGVAVSGATTVLPMNGGMGDFYTIEGEPVPEKGKEPLVQIRGITPGYLEAMHINLMRGRPITTEDRLAGRPVALVNEAMVREHWNAGEPLGHRITLSSGTYDIVGVVADAREFGPDDDAPSLVFVPEFQRGFRNMSLVLRTTADPGSLGSKLREAVSAQDPGLPIYDLQTMDELVKNRTQGDKIMPRLLGIFGGVALVLAVLGVYSVMAYMVTQRTKEVGIRLALGADGNDILKLVVGQGSRLAITGTLVGLGLAALTTRALSAFLFGVSAFDPLVFGGVTLALLGAALLASLIPARRASRVSPLIALRAE